MLEITSGEELDQGALSMGVPLHLAGGDLTNLQVSCQLLPLGALNGPNQPALR